MLHHIEVFGHASRHASIHAGSSASTPALGRLSCSCVAVTWGSAEGVAVLAGNKPIHR